jgi:hypothetical protein
VNTRQRALAAPVRHSLLLLPLLLGASSIASLLLYFYGVLDMRRGVVSVLLPAIALLILTLVWARLRGQEGLAHRMAAGLWAGGLATLTYDLVRVPIAWSGVPVFKAISYFGTVILGTAEPGFLSELIGWAYHLSNGIGFGLMYTAFVTTPRWWSAVLWGLLLEGAMLLTPYAEVFGYRLSANFLAITIGAHVVYGLTLWAALRYGYGLRPASTSPPPSMRRLLLFSTLIPLGIGAVAVDFHLRHAEAIPPSPPASLGPHLYVTWHIPEPDRLAAMWLYRRFIDPRAQFHFIPPFSTVRYGTPFDTPEAAIRRSGNRSVTELLVSQHGLGEDPRLQRLARMTHLYEITPWMGPSDPAAQELGEKLMAAAGQCQPARVAACVTRAFQYLDGWYAQTLSEERP